jgi:hypothetical protein
MDILPPKLTIHLEVKNSRVTDLLLSLDSTNRHGDSVYPRTRLSGESATQRLPFGSNARPLGNNNELEVVPGTPPE